MTEVEWLQSDDAGSMLDFLWKQKHISPHWTNLRFGGDVREGVAPDDFELALHRFYLASCRSIWKLLPQEASRRGIEMAELWIAGKATDEELSAYNWHVEGAAFCIDYNTEPDDIARWVDNVRAFPKDELKSMLHTSDNIEPRELLKRAAYFADYAMIYPSLRPKGPPPMTYRHFLSAAVLRKHIQWVKR